MNSIKLKAILSILILVIMTSYPLNKLKAQTNFTEAPINLDSLYSHKQLGSFISEGNTVYRLFAPSAQKVILCTFKNADDKIGEMYEMNSDADGVWEYVLMGDLSGTYYGFKVIANDDKGGIKKLPLVVDPYAKAVTTFTTYMNPRKSIVVNDNFNWEGDTWIKHDWRDLVIYEMHIKDITAHPSAKSTYPGTYKGLVEPGKTGGINYIKQLGVNSVELLPAMEFATMEIPYKDSLQGRFNTWNAYERNYWGYMTSNFFAPAAYYAENWSEFKRNQWMGRDGHQVTDFKNMVKAFHKEGIAVIMDVVFNHLSEYEIGNLKQIDKEYYFRLNNDGSFVSESYCGNDLKTERPMMRRLIVESILFWMKEYHVDGFRFDLGKLLDWQTIEEIIHEAKKINPNVVIVCEPWGGGYDPQGFSLRGWGAWNDQIRNGIKGENPVNGHGWIFENWYGNNSVKRIKSYAKGTLVKDSLGLFQKPEHSVNYLESHDGYTLGDFIRIGLGDIKPDEIIKNIDENAKLTEKQLALNKLAALFLFTSRGITMISEGQEFARSKVIPFTDGIDDKHQGMIDHNTYNKDNSVNYLNYEHANLNNNLLNYYKGLIQLRNKYSAFRRAEYDEIHFYELESQFGIAYLLNHKSEKIFVAMNAQLHTPLEVNLPKGNWDIVVNDKTAGTKKLGSIKNKIVLPPSSGMVLIKQ